MISRSRGGWHIRPLPSKSGNHLWASLRVAAEHLLKQLALNNNAGPSDRGNEPQQPHSAAVMLNDCLDLLNSQLYIDVKLLPGSHQSR
jgi:hypothetical protein